MVSANREPEAASLNQIDSEKASKSLGGNNEGENNVTSSKGEVQINDQTNVPVLNFDVPTQDNKNDAPNCNTESAACLSNQGCMIGGTGNAYLGRAWGDARIICRPVDISDENGSVLSVGDKNQNASLDIRGSLSLPLSVIDSEKLVAVTSTE